MSVKKGELSAEKNICLGTKTINIRCWYWRLKLSVDNKISCPLKNAWQNIPMITDMSMNTDADMCIGIVDIDIVMDTDMETDMDMDT